GVTASVSIISHSGVVLAESTQTFSGISNRWISFPFERAIGVPECDAVLQISLSGNKRASLLLSRGAKTNSIRYAVRRGQFTGSTFVAGIASRKSTSGDDPLDGGMFAVKVLRGPAGVRNNLGQEA